MLSNDRKLRVVIPSRFNSHRLPGKPLVDLAGTPMVVRVFSSVSSALTDADIVVAVDDVRVKQVLDDHDIPALMTSLSCESGTDRAAEVAIAREWLPDDVIVNVQGDEPLLPPDLLRAFVGYCRSQRDFAMATVSVPIEEQAEIFDPNVVKVVTRKDGTAVTFSRAPIPFDRDRAADRWDVSNYRRHLGIYAYRSDALHRLTRAPSCALENLERLEQLRALWLGIPVHVLEWHSPPPAGVDTHADVVRVQAMLEGLVG